MIGGLQMNKWDEWIKNAKTEEERKKWEEVKEMHEKYGFDFMDGWYVNIYKQKCGHYEILQTSRLGRTDEEIKQHMTKESAQRTCSNCILSHKF
jgi:hypothetical protein